MKKLLFLLIAIAFATPQNLMGQASKGELNIQLSGFRNNSGTVWVSLYNNEIDFPDKGANAYGKSKAVIVNGKATVTIKDVVYGNYAVAILHDENNNMKMDYKLLGMPKEGYGFSNDAKGSFGPPSFEKALFKVDTHKKLINIRVQYL